MRDINITASCAHCGEVLDTNEASRDEFEDGILEGAELHVGTQHECFDSESDKFVEVKEDEG